MSLPTQNKRVVKEEKEISCESATPLFIYTIYMSYAHHGITTHMTYELRSVCMSLSLTEKHICSSYQDCMLKSSMTQIQTLSHLQYIQALYNT